MSCAGKKIHLMEYIFSLMQMLLHLMAITFHLMKIFFHLWIKCLSDRNLFSSDGRKFPSGGSASPCNGKKFPSDGNYLPLDGNLFPSDGSFLPSGENILPSRKKNFINKNLFPCGEFFYSSDGQFSSSCHDYGKKIINLEFTSTWWKVSSHLGYKLEFWRQSFDPQRK